MPLPSIAQITGDLRGPVPLLLQQAAKDSEKNMIWAHLFSFM